MSKFHCRTKGDFQAMMFRDVVEKFLEGGNLAGDQHIDEAIEQIVIGLSKAWDLAEESTER